MRKKYFLTLMIASLFTIGLSAQSSVSETYSDGDIPTSYTDFDDTCNGPEATLSIELPASGGPWEVVGIDVEYDMTAAGGAWMSEQRSLIHSQNTGEEEEEVSGSGALAGTYNYSREDLEIANGYYADEEELIFQMRAWRTYGSIAPNDGCGTYYNKVDDGTWTITVYYEVAPSCLPPQEAEAEQTDDDEAEISWNEIGDATEWDIEYGSTGFTPGSGTTVTGVTSSPHTLSGLSENTAYDVYVTSDCGDGDLSSPSDVAYVEILGEGAACDNPIEISGLPYDTDDSTGDYLNNYSGAVGSDCGTSENYLNGYDVVYQYTPTDDMAINIYLSDLSDFYAGVFIYESCDDIGSACVGGGVNTAQTDDLGVFDVELEGGQDYYIVISSWLTEQFDYNLQIEESLCPQPSNVEITDLGNDFVNFSWGVSVEETDGYEWGVMNQGEHPDSDTPVDSDVTASGATSLNVTGLSAGTDYSFYIKSDCGATNGTSDWIGPIDFSTYITTGDIPTSYNEFDDTCNGPNYTITHELPATGGPWEVTGIDIEYDMTAANIAYMSEQRSLIYFQNTGEGEVEEDDAYSGEGTEGTYSYSREDVAVANGYYPDGEELIFEMRAWRTYGSAAPNDGCSTYYNKVDDGTWEITVHYEPAPSCIPVSNVEVEEIADDEFEVSWDEIGDATEWNIEYGPAGFTPGTGTVETGVTTDPYTVTGLTSGAEYDVYIQANCGDGDLSDWTGPSTVGVGIPTATYTDGDIPTSYDGFDDTCNGPNTTLSIMLPSTGGPWEVTGFDVEYDMTAANGAWMSEQRSLIYSQNTGEGEEEVSGAGLAAGTYNYSREGVEVANGYYPDGEELIFEMRAWRTYGSIAPNDGCNTYYNQVDDGSWTITVYYQEAPSCLPTQNVSITRTAEDEVEVSWDEIGTATEWNIEYGSIDFEQGTGTLISNVDTNPYTISDLEPNTEYEVYVQANCEDGELSDWSDSAIEESGADCDSPIEVWSLPYATEDTTSDYGDDYDGSAGDDCGSTSNYLAGDDVVYHYVPNENMEINIALTELTNNYAGVFVYESCEDIGTTCYNGATNGGSDADLFIDELPVTEGEDYYIVVSTWATPQSVDYDLDITKVCDESPNSPTAESEQSLCIGSTVSDIMVTGEDVRWYEEEAGGEVLPEDVELTDQETYYASQILNSCESVDRTEVLVSLYTQSELPEGSINQVYEDGDTVEDLDVEGESVTWYANEEGTEVIEDPTEVELEDQETYYASQTIDERCESELLPVTVHYLLDVTGMEVDGLSYYPNPVENVLNITTTGKTIDSLEVYNLVGQKVLEQKINTQNTSINLETLSSGTYLLKVNVEGQTGVYKIVKM